MLEIFKQKGIVILVSILWGFGLASLFSSVANRRNCILVRGEHPNEIEEKVFQYPDIEDKCYQYKSYLSPCKNEIYKSVKIQQRQMEKDKIIKERYEKYLHL